MKIANLKIKKKIIKRKFPIQEKIQKMEDNDILSYIQRHPKES